MSVERAAHARELESSTAALDDLKIEHGGLKIEHERLLEDYSGLERMLQGEEEGREKAVLELESAIAAAADARDLAQREVILNLN